MSFIIKTIVSAIIISFASWLAGRKPILAGFIIALPIMSMLSILFAYLEHKNMSKVNQFADSILVAVPLSLTFFIPFFLNKWFKLNFALTYGLGIIFLIIAFALHQFIFKTAGIR
jgi:hypothetical protein